MSSTILEQNDEEDDIIDENHDVEPTIDDNDYRDITVSFQGFSRHVDHENFADDTILLDSGSSCSVFKNKQLFKNIKASAIPRLCPG